jgi:hypothetical protein
MRASLTQRHATLESRLAPAAGLTVSTSPATVTKLADRGSHQTVGIVTDAEPFLRALVHELP